MSRYIPESFTSGTVAAGGTLVVNHAILANQINLLKIKVVPSVILGTNKIEIFKKDTCLPADLAYSTDDYLNTLCDPVEDDAGITIERNEGFVCPYEDSDETLELHIKITNNHTVSKTYAFTIEYELAPAAMFLTKTTTGDFASGNEGTIVINTFDNNVKIRADGAWRQIATW